MSCSRSRGFTLIELMIVVAVIAILALVALPSYLAQVRHSRRSDAITQINTIALAEEQWRANCPQFVSWGDTTTCPSVGVAFMSQPGATSYYKWDLSNVPSATQYTITATPLGDQLKDAQFGTPCTSLTYTVNAGIVTKAPAACWGQ